MPLDLDNRDIGYNLGRLFAVFEFVQERVRPKGPRVVARYEAMAFRTQNAFPQLFADCISSMPRLERLDGVDPGQHPVYELVGSIMEHIDPYGVPESLTPMQRCMFAAGHTLQSSALHA